MSSVAPPAFQISRRFALKTPFPPGSNHLFSLDPLSKEHKIHLRPSRHMTPNPNHRIYTTSFASVYPHYVTKAEKKGRGKTDVDTIICWLTGYTQKQFEEQLKKETDFQTFFKEAPELNPARTSIKGVICGIRVEDIEDPLTREIRYLDKLIDELAKGKPMEKILRA